MSIAIIITFRECLEMLIIIVPLLVYLHKSERTDLAKYIYTGCGAGIVTSIITAAILVGQVNKLDGYVQQLFLGITMIFLSSLILYSIVMVSKQSKNLSLNITDKYDVKLSAISMFLLAFITIFRESLEIIIFLLPTFCMKPFLIIIGVLIGILLALVLSFIIFKTSIKLNIYVIFSILTLILIFMGGSLFGEGLEIIFPQIKESISILGQLVYTIPLLYLFLKKELKKYLKK